jgi:hypothetical protein
MTLEAQRSYLRRRDRPRGLRPCAGPVYPFADSKWKVPHMIVLIAALIGAILGWQRAARLGGNRKDRLQYAIVFALILAVAGLFVTIFVHRAAA